MMGWTKQTKTVFVTDDGTEHDSEAFARQHAANKTLREIFDRTNMCNSRSGIDGQDIINALSNYTKEVREWLDACDALTKEVLS